MYCTGCGAPEEAGYSACRRCNAPYAHAPAVGERRGVGPTNCKRRDGHVSRNASVALVDGRITISSGTPSVISLQEITDVRGEDSFNGEHYSGTRWVILRFHGQEVGFMMKPENAAMWLEALGAYARR